jgi:sulfite reductase alpha subunit-like flavoprotein
MAKDVEATLRRIAADQGGLREDGAAAAWLEALTRGRRLRKDVY